MYSECILLFDYMFGNVFRLNVVVLALRPNYKLLLQLSYYYTCTCNCVAISLIDSLIVAEATLAIQLLKQPNTYLYFFQAAGACCLMSAMVIYSSCSRHRREPI